MNTKNINALNKIQKLLPSLAALIVVVIAGLVARSYTNTVTVSAKSGPTSTASSLPEDNLAQIPNSSFSSSTINEITVFVGNYRTKENEFLLDVCFDMLDRQDWLISQNTSLVDAHGQTLRWFTMEVIEIRNPPTNKNGKLQQEIITGTGPETYRNAKPGQKYGQRCDTLHFQLSNQQFDFSQFTLTIPDLTVQIPEGALCDSNSPYIKKMQGALDKHKMNIKVKHQEKHVEGMGCNFEIASLPQGMNKEDALSKLQNEDVYLDAFGIRGPWIFQGNLP